MTQGMGDALSDKVGIFDQRSLSDRFRMTALISSVRKVRSGEVHAADKLMGVLFDAFEERRRQALIGRNVIVFEHNP